MKRRMHHLFAPDGNAFVLAMDHASTMPSPELDDAGRIIRLAVAAGIDAFLVPLGTLKRHAKDIGRAGVILRADGGVTTLRLQPGPLRQLFSAEDAIFAGADALLGMGFPGSEQNEHTLAAMARLGADCDRVGLPWGLEMLPYGYEQHEDIDTRSAESVAFACRLGTELGADFIKTAFTGRQSFAKVTANCPVPVLILGGGRSQTDEAVLQSVEDAMACGAKGVIMGRSIFRHPDIGAMCQAVASIIHGGATATDALRALKS